MSSLCFCLDIYTRTRIGYHDGRLFPVNTISSGRSASNRGTWFVSGCIVVRCIAVARFREGLSRKPGRIRGVRRITAVVIVFAVLVAAITSVAAGSPASDGGETAGSANDTGRGIELAAALPNPVAHGDRGEYVVLSIPEATNLSGWSIADDHGVASLPNRTVSGRVVLTTDPEAVSADGSVLELRGNIALSNAGERIELRRENRTVDGVTYDRASEGELYVRDDGEWTWRPLGATDRPVVRADDARVQSFVLPDSPDAPVDPLRNATDRILLSGYTITSDRVVRALCAAHDRGVRVRTLFEGGPVGGITSRAKDRLDSLAACGIPVSVIGGEHARYTFHHAKYAVVDDAAIVLTENWKPSGTGGRSSRGWGTVVHDVRVAETLAETFRADAGFRDAIPWEQYRGDVDPVDDHSAPSERYPARFEPRTTNATRVSVLVAPDNAETAIVSEIDAAEDSIRVEQISIGSRNHPFVRALLRAARRGVTVRVLLGSAWYVRADNREIVAWLNERAEEEGLALKARLATPRSRFEKVHAKGIVVDDTAILGSINWTNESIRANREVALRIEDEAFARYYTRVFRADWRGGVWSVSAGLLALVTLAVVGAALVGRRMTFDPGYSASPEAADA
jgi:phosphatidylserine/phosphatidylglycerophosphate/cardiolipin synthase-like enzyme